MSWSRIIGVFFRYFYVTKKGLHQLSDLFYWPLVDILIWGLTCYWIETQGHLGSLRLTLLTALIFWQIVWRGSLDISTSLLLEFWQRNLMNLFSTPLKISEWISGMLLLGICKLIITIAFSALVVYLFFAVNLFAVGWALIPFALCLLLFGWAVSFLGSSLIIYWGHRVEMIAWMSAWIFSPFSAIFYPVEVLPLWAQKISWCLPTTYIFEAMRSVLAQGTFPLSYVWISLGLNLIFLTFSLLIFRWTFEKTREKGLARLE